MKTLVGKIVKTAFLKEEEYAVSDDTTVLEMIERMGIAWFPDDVVNGVTYFSATECSPEYLRVTQTHPGVWDAQKKYNNVQALNGLSHNDVRIENMESSK